jgi:aspartate racemase
MEFYKKIISTYQKKSCNERPSILIASVSIPYTVEQNFILKNQGVERYKPFLTDAAMSLEKAGADFLVMPCNSLHVLIEDIRNAVKISVVSIIDETVQFLKKNNFSKVALISTLATIKNRLYETAFDSNDIVYLKPNQEEQIQIGNIISNLVQGKIVEEDSTILEKIIHNFEGQVDCVVLACTDLQLLQPKHPHLKILDTMHILADAVVIKLKKEEHKI